MIVNENIAKIVKKYRENKLSHAFLIETNDLNKCSIDILEAVKVIICPNKQKSTNCDETCNLCHLVDNNALPSLKIVETSDTTIKKEQILELKRTFQSKSLYTIFSIYIIKNAEKLTKSSANTMLKFLEEPDGQVIGFFLTESRENIIETIKSRCQLYVANYNQTSVNEELHITLEEYTKYLEILKKYVKLLETNPEMCFVNNRKLVLETIKERTELEMFFKIILKIYNSFLNKSLSVTELAPEFQEFDYILNNSVRNIIKKLQIIKNIMQNLQYNPNLELTLDKFVIEMRQTNG